MLIYHRVLVLVCITFIYQCTSFAMVYDNRYFPWYLRTFSRTPEKPSCIIPDIFMVTAHHGRDTADNSVGIPEILGKYNQKNVADALVLLGFTNPLPTNFQSEEILWNMHGKLEGEGIALTYNQQLSDYWSTGMSIFFMHLFTRHEFELNERDVVKKLDLTQQDIDALDLARRTMNSLLDLQTPKWSATGVSDIDCFIRFGLLREYYLKFKRMDIGIKLGLMIPTGKKRDINNPASIPFGGNGHWGIYGDFDSEFELKEDLIVGLWGRFNYRFNKTSLQRMPAANEQQLYGALVGNVKVKPGMTFIASPYIQVNNVRDGLGLQAKFTYVWHDEDIWRDRRTIKTIPAFSFKEILRTSEWTAEYLTLTGFYDFSFIRNTHCLMPKLSLMWDIPVDLFGAERVSKTNRISLGLEFNF